MKSSRKRFLLTLAVATFALNLNAARPSRGHQSEQSGPIEMGTSGGWKYDLANGYCCGGTLGSLIRFSDGSLHILSNFHVLAADTEPGGNGNIAMDEDPVIHPALIDVSCDASSAREIALLSDYADPLNPKSGSKVIDAATAQIVPGEVDPSGSILRIGQLANVTLPASVGLNVKKSGRTTGFTRSSIAFIGATINVEYENECAGESRGVASFTDQIVINNSGSGFLAGGDSGSLLVEDVSEAPRSVGLLFAGSSSYAIANPIDDVLAAFNAEMVGVTPPPPGSGDGGGSTSPGKGNKGGGKKPKSDKAKIALAKAAQKKAAALLSAAPKGLGHGVGVDEQGEPYIAVFVESEGSVAASSVPASIDGIPVVIVETGKIVAF